MVGATCSHAIRHVLTVGTPREFADAALAAEQAGWDAVFTWEAVWGQDAWMTLTAAALRTRTRSGSARC